MSFKKKDNGKRPKESIEKEITNVRAERNNRENKDIIESINKSKRYFFENTDNIKPMVNQLSKKE